MNEKRRIRDGLTNQQRYQKRRMAEGKCMLCGKERNCGSRQLCRRCLTKKSDRYHAKRQREGHSTERYRCARCGEFGHHARRCVGVTPSPPPDDGETPSPPH